MSHLTTPGPLRLAIAGLTLIGCAAAPARAQSCGNLLTGEFGGTFGTIATNSRRNLQIPATAGYGYGGGGANSLALAGTYVVTSRNGTNAIHPGTSHWENLFGHNAGGLQSNDDAFLAINGSSTVAVFFRQAVTLVPGQQYRFSAWALNAVADPTGNPEIGIRLRNSDGAIVSADTTGVLPARTGSGATLNSPWQEASNIFTSGAGGTFTLEAFNVSTSGSGNDLALDDISIVPLTEAGCPADYGDAPDAGPGTGTRNYNTLALDNGPRHELVAGLTLGTAATTEVEALQNASANGDLDDGFLTTDIMTNNGGTVSIPGRITNTTGTDAFGRGFVDFNGDGDFLDGGETSALVTIPPSATLQTVNFVFTAPSGLADLQTFMRFRLSRIAAEIATSTGSSESGEVEDYPVTITVVPRVVITKVSQGGVGPFSFTGNNGVAVHTITTTTAGAGARGPAYILTSTDTATTLTETSLPAGFTLDSVVCTGLSSGGTATPTINGTAGGSVLLDAAAVGTTGNIACTFTNRRLAADLAITKTNTPAAGNIDQAADTLVRGASTTYSIRVTNNGPDPITGAIVRDTPASGLTCPVDGPVTITGSGVPAGAFTATELTGAGIILGTLPINETAILTVTCMTN